MNFEANNKMDQLRWGIIGSYDTIQDFTSDLDNVKDKHILYAMVPVDNQPSDKTIIVTHTYTDFQDLLQSDVDAIYIASPYHQHYTQVKQCLLYGKPVLCERPIAQTTIELKHLMQLSEHNNVFMMEAMWIRFLPSIKKVLSIISSGGIGEIVSVKALVLYKQDETSQIIGNPGESALFESGIYPVFLCTLLLGKPNYIQATGNVKGDREEFFSAFLSYEDGRYGFIETTTLIRSTSVAIITGGKGCIEIKNPWGTKQEGIKVTFFDGPEVLHKTEWKGHGLQFELDEVYECLEDEAIESQLYCHHFNLDVLETMNNIRKQLL